MNPSAIVIVPPRGLGYGGTRHWSIPKHDLLTKMKDAKDTNRRQSVFLASSSEGLEIANAIHSELEFIAEVTLWNQEVFRPSATGIENMLRSLSNFDFAIFVFTPDDAVDYRGTKSMVVRDNVMFELGMFLGRIGRDRCFFFMPRDSSSLRIPTDMSGMVPLIYDSERTDGNWRAAVGPSCDQVRKIIKASGPIKRWPVSEMVHYKTEISEAERVRLENSVDEILERATAEQLSVVALFFDIDQFSAMNRYYGVGVCNQIIKKLSGLISEHFKDAYVQRLGGDQFVACITGVTLAQGVRDAAEIAKKIASYHWSRMAPNLFVTVSIGAANYRQTDTVQEETVYREVRDICRKLST